MWNDFEHQVWKQLKTHQLNQSDQYLMAVSAGVDSMVLLKVMQRLRPDAQMIVMHYHHGPGENILFRDECVKLLETLSGSQIILEIDQSSILLESENDLREARRAFFEKIKTKYKLKFYLTAHHLDDVLETRLLKLIRGVSIEGLSQFCIWNNFIFRPLLELSKSQLMQYARENSLKWCDDPTNFENDYLRNWLRNSWLHDLEVKVPGGRVALARSLQNIVMEFEKNEDLILSESQRYIKFENNKVSLERSWFAVLSTKDQLKMLVHVIKTHFQTSFSQSQLKEILKQLDKNQNDHIFKAANLIWLTDRNTIMLKLEEYT